MEVFDFQSDVVVPQSPPPGEEGGFDSLLTDDEAAEALAVGTDWVRSHAEEIPGFCPLGMYYRFHRALFQQWVGGPERLLQPDEVAKLLIELSLRKLFRQALIDLPFPDRIEVQDAEKSIGKGTKGVSDFGFGELVGLFRQSNLLKKWSQSTGRQLGLLSTLDFAATAEAPRKGKSGATETSRPQGAGPWRKVENRVLGLQYGGDTQTLEGLGEEWCADAA